MKPRLRGILALLVIIAFVAIARLALAGPSLSCSGSVTKKLDPGRQYIVGISHDNFKCERNGESGSAPGQKMLVKIESHTDSFSYTTTGGEVNGFTWESIVGDTVYYDC
jgi:hypothetical protein